MEPSEFQISTSVDSYDEKNAENERNGYAAEKRIVSKQSKILILNFNRKFLNSIKTTNFFSSLLCRTAISKSKSKL